MTVHRVRGAWHAMPESAGNLSPPLRAAGEAIHGCHPPGPRHGLLRRCAPRNDDFGVATDRRQVRH